MHQKPEAQGGAELRARIDPQVIQAWTAVQAAHHARCRKAAGWMVLPVALLIAAVVFDVIAWSAALWLFVMGVGLTSLIINGKRVCPACGQIPNGTKFRVVSLRPDFCMHCNHWLAAPLRQPPRQ